MESGLQLSEDFLGNTSPPTQIQESEANGAGCIVAVLLLPTLWFAFSFVHEGDVQWPLGAVVFAWLFCVNKSMSGRKVFSWPARAFAVFIFLGYPIHALSHFHRAARVFRELGGFVDSSGDGMTEFLGSRGITYVSFAGSDLDDDGLKIAAAKLEKLTGNRSLDLSATQITDRGLQWIVGLTVNPLDLAATDITPAGWAEFCEQRRKRKLSIPVPIHGGNLTAAVSSSGQYWSTAYSVRLQHVIAFRRFLDTKSDSEEIILQACPSCLAFTPDDKQLIIGDVAGNLHLYELASRRMVHVPVGIGVVPLAISVRQDSRQLAVCGGKWDANTWSFVTGTVSLWDVQTNKLRQLADRSGERFNAVAYADTTTLAAGSSDGVVQIWNLAKADGAPKSIQLGGSIRALEFSPDSKILAIAGKGFATAIFEVATLKKLRTYDHLMGTISSLAFHPNGKLLAGGGCRPIVKSTKIPLNVESIRVWNVATGDVQSAFPQSFWLAPKFLKFSLAGNELLYANESEVSSLPFKP